MAKINKNIFTDEAKAKAKAGRKNPMKLSAAKSIRKHCFEQCCGGDRESHIGCSVPKCPLYPYRLGKTPTKADADAHYEAELGL